MFSFVFSFNTFLGASASVTGMFHLDGTTGVLTTSSTFDYQTMTYYDISVQAEDGGGTAKSVTRSLRVGITDVNDNIPGFAQSSYAVDTTEGSAADTSVLTLVATDSDDSFTPTYAFLSGNSASMFRLDGNLLEINTAIDLDAGTSDSASYSLVITVADGHVTELTGTTTVFVTVLSTNDHDPAWATWSPAYASATTTYDIAEDSAISTSIVTLSATDDDYSTDGQITYTIVSVLDSEFIFIVMPQLCFLFISQYLSR